MTLGAISDRIADELVRPDLRASHVPLSVKDAIREAANYRFWFNEVRGLSFNTVADQDFYDQAALPDLAWLSRVDALWIVVNGQRRNLTLVNALAVNDWKDGDTILTGEPCHYARYGDGFLLWMVPRDVWPVYIDGTTRFSELTADSDSNAYLTEGERYIRALAKANLLENVVRDFAQADRQWQVAEREKRNLLMETANRISTNRLAACL
ncbi:hypothetical protein SAMN02927924_01430 [Sphingobium faniae]|nr:hypothetical protein SAMN02927924_01430 [Sphingobium faniae]